MALSKEEIIELGTVLVGILALFIVLSRGGNTQVSAPSAELPEGSGAPTTYLTYNQPQSTPSFAAPALPTVASMSNPNAPAPSCGCSGSGTLVSFASTTDFTNWLNSQLGGFLNTYQDAVLSGLPPALTQNIGVPASILSGAAPAGEFSSMGS